MSANDYGLPRSVQVGERELDINGYGKREILFFDAYACALYLARPSSDASFIMSGDISTAIVVRVLANDPPDEFPDKWDEILRQEISGRAYRRLEKAFERLSTGDKIQFLYGPGQGTRVLLNDKQVVSDPGHGLMVEILDHWIGSDPVSIDLASALLAR
ncbi:chalcone isomerase family protein [Algihabitans albus]|uniref:chalcone isomerase family protein n=1 Tax=Algihabitans albus TaxID=2164067 RepID=UPI0013C36C38|nr:chalcone isomerase family protein [Algihabitans albus]